MRLIDADALISEMQETADVIARATGNTARWTILMKFIEIIKRYPTIEPKRGQWEFVQYDANPKIGNYHCSQCGLIAEPLSYCPHCGTKMEEVEE